MLGFPLKKKKRRRGWRHGRGHDTRGAEHGLDRAYPARVAVPDEQRNVFLDQVAAGVCEVLLCLSSQRENLAAYKAQGVE